MIQHTHKGKQMKYKMKVEQQNNKTIEGRVTSAASSVTAAPTTTTPTATTATTTQPASKQGKSPAN